MDKTTPPDVSVIIAAYNVQNHIERAVRSALDQQGVTVEVIVIDDGSSDDTIGVVTRLNDARIKLLQSPGNGGPSVARNLGIAAAAAPWIAILDGDDAFAPDRLRRCLQNARNRQADIVVDNLEVLREKDGTRYIMFRPQNFGSRLLLDLATFIAGNSSFLGGTSLGYVKPLFSMAFLRQHNLSYDPALRIGEDYMLLAQALACGARCAVVRDSFYLYTVRADSISHRLSLADVTRIEEGDRKFLAQYTLNRAAQKAQARRTRRLHAAYYFTELVEALKRRDRLAILKIVIMHPRTAFYLWRPLWARLT